MTQGRGACEHTDLLCWRDDRHHAQPVAEQDVLAVEAALLDALQELVRTCVEVGGASAAGIVVRNREDGVEVLAAAQDESRLVELFRFQESDGPCLQAMNSGERMTVLDVATSAPAAAPGLLGYSAVHAFPMRLGEQRIGALSLFYAAPHGLSEEDARTAQALADIAAVSILQLCALRSSRRLTDQLQAALDSRVVIEQAKGVLSEAGKVDMERAFARLREYARNRNLRLATVAAAVANRGLSAADVLAGGPSPRCGASLARPREV
jgi:transcriptional regulator with GAF, ATPase, and Fis domain